MGRRGVRGIKEQVRKSVSLEVSDTVVSSSVHTNSLLASLPTTDTSLVTRAGGSRRTRKRVRGIEEQMRKPGALEVSDTVVSSSVHTSSLSAGLPTTDASPVTPAGGSRRRRKRVEPEEEELPCVLPEKEAKKSKRPSWESILAAAIPAGDICFHASAPGIRIGTSGCSYSAWHQAGMQFYPKGITTSQEFMFYSQRFDTVELNGTFYRWHNEESFDAWREAAAHVRPSFQYVVKAPRTFTHMKRLNVDADWIDKWQRYWASRMLRMKPHLGAMLFQFPVTVERDKPAKAGEARTNLEALASLSQVLPKGERFVFEFRHPSWFCQEVNDILAANDWCFSALDVCRGPHEGTPEGGESPAEKAWTGALADGTHPPRDQYPLTCSWGAYVRFHGATGQYLGSYGQGVMNEWAAWACRIAQGGRTVYLMFNNDGDGVDGLPSAIADCRYLATAMRENGTFV